MNTSTFSVATRGLVMVEYAAYDSSGYISYRLLGVFATEDEAQTIIVGTIPKDWDRVNGYEEDELGNFRLTPVTLGISPERMAVAYANAEVRRLREERGLKA